MTKEEKIDAFTMRLDGYTLQEIGDKYGLTRERIRKMFASITTESGISRKNYIYPNISDWMIDNNVKQSDLSKKLGCAQNTISSYLTGKKSPSFAFINLMLELTKMPYEVVFFKRENGAGKMKRNIARLILILAVIAWAIIVVSVLITPVNADAAPIEEPKEDDGRIPGDDVPATERCYMTDEEVQESFENENIQNALLAKANRIQNCTVTWYTEATCGKTPDNPAYGITASGLPVVEHLTVAVDRSVIPLYSDVFVQYADGTIEQLWATDTGVNGNHIDIYTPDYDYAIQMGRQQLTVWWVEAD